MNVQVVIVRDGGIITQIEVYDSVETMNEAGYYSHDTDEMEWPHTSLIISEQVVHGREEE